MTFSLSAHLGPIFATVTSDLIVSSYCSENNSACIILSCRPVMVLLTNAERLYVREIIAARVTFLLALMVL